MTRATPLAGAAIAAAGVISPLRGSDPAVVAERALGERAAGRIPLVGDDRWSEQHWAAVLDRVAAAGPQPGQGWATLTSGSTGDPRIVLRTTASWEASFGPVAELIGLRADDVLALSSPPASSLSLFSVAHSAAAGFVLALPRSHTLTAEDARSATVFHGTPNGFRALLDAGAPPRLRAALIGGAFLDRALRERARIAGIRVVSYYGAAELSFVAYDDGDPDDDGLRAFPGVELDVRDDDVLWVRSAYVATGYLHEPPLGSDDDPTRKSAGPLRRDGEWRTVGDRAELSDGRLRLLGRADDAILTAAATVVPAEVEEALRRIDGVLDAVVFGLPNEGVGELVTAVLEVAPGRQTRPTRSSVRSAAATLLAPAHVPRRWFRVDELPRTVSGKPARAELIAQVKAGEVARLEP